MLDSRIYPLSPAPSPLLLRLRALAADFKKYQSEQQ